MGKITSVYLSRVLSIVYRIKNLFTLYAGRCTLDAKKGFTLIEIMIAAMIMAVTIGGLFSVFIAGNRFVLRSSRRLAAVNFAQEQIENRREFVRFDTWPNANDGNNLGVTGGGVWTAWSGPSTFQPTSFRYSVEQAPRFNTPVPFAIQLQGCRRVYLQVRWSEPQ